MMKQWDLAVDQSDHLLPLWHNGNLFICPHSVCSTGPPYGVF